MPAEEWTVQEHVARYLRRADDFPHRLEGESVLLEHVPADAGRILDLGTGDGRLLERLRVDRPGLVGVGVDLSEVMLAAARDRFACARRTHRLSCRRCSPTRGAAPPSSAAPA